MASQTPKFRVPCLQQGMSWGSYRIEQAQNLSTGLTKKSTSSSNCSSPLREVATSSRSRLPCQGVSGCCPSKSGRRHAVEEGGPRGSAAPRPRATGRRSSRDSLAFARVPRTRRNSAPNPAQHWSGSRPRAFRCEGPSRRHHLRRARRRGGRISPADRLPQPRCRPSGQATDWTDRLRLQPLPEPLNPSVRAVPRRPIPFPRTALDARCHPLPVLPAATPEGPRRAPFPRRSSARCVPPGPRESP